MTELPADFILPVDKPEGPTSHDVVRAARLSLGIRRVGHTGTLDPFASGLLLLCIGRATRLAEYLSGLDKTYDAVARLGQSTDTLDRDGSLVDERGGWVDLDQARLEAALEPFIGEIDQVPPAFSAKKVGGEAAHRRVRRGETVDLPPARVRVDALELASVDLPFVTWRVTCSSGTYVRALARDVGESLGVGAHLVSLRRTRIGAFDVDGAVQVDELAVRERVAAAVLGPLEALSHLPLLDVDEEAARRLAQGQAVPVPEASGHGPVVVSHAGDLVAVGDTREGVLRPKKVFLA